MFGKKKSKVMSVDAKLAEIKALGAADGKKSRKKDKDGSNSADGKFYRLLNYLDDENAECRIAAAREIGKTSRDVALTHLLRNVSIEKDERVAAAMKAAIASIKSRINSKD